jgi:hypothetical protein
MGDIEKSVVSTRDILDFSTCSLDDFLKNEKENLMYNDENEDTIFDEIKSLCEDKFQVDDHERTIEDILKEAEALINQPIGVQSYERTEHISCESTPLEIRNNLLDQYDYSTATNTLQDVSMRKEKKACVLALLSK